jgi:hypothetical protein
MRQRSGGSRFKDSPGKQFTRPYLENTLHKKGVAQVVENLPSKCEALSQNHSTAKNKNQPTKQKKPSDFMGLTQ